MLYVDDKLPTHPKIFRAGSMLGDNGPALALALYMAGLSYAREHLTDGFIPDKFVTSCGLIQTPQSVARALSSRAVRLWHRVRGGYRIHDYHDWNRSAFQIKEKREADRKKKSAQRQRQAAMSLGLSHRDTSRDPMQDAHQTSRARASTNHVRSTTNKLELVPPEVRRKITAARASVAVENLRRTDRPIASFQQLCVLAHYAIDGLGDDAALSDIADEMKWAIAEAHMDCCADELHDAVDAVLVARAKGYRTPRERKAP